MANTNDSMNGTLAYLPPESLSIKVIKIIACVVVMTIALVGNILIIAVIHKNAAMRKTINYFILNMAVSDLIVPLVILPRVIVETSSESSNWQASQGPFGEFLCKFVNFLSDITMAVSILSLICIAIDRFCAVVFPLKLSLITSRVRVGLLLFTWVFSALYFSALFYSMRLESSQGHTECILVWSEDQDLHLKLHSAFITSSTILYIVIPAITLTILYTVILVFVRIKIVSNQEQQGNTAARRAANNCKLLKLALLTVGAFAVCYGPFNIYLFYITFILKWKIKDYQFFHRFRFAAEFLTFTNSALNPCLYFIFIENFRRGLIKLINCGKQDNRDRLYATETSRATRMIRIDNTRCTTRTASMDKDKETLIEKD